MTWLAVCACIGICACICVGIFVCVCVCVRGRGRVRPSIELVHDRRVVAGQPGFDAYFAGMTPCDLAARGAPTREAVREAYLAAVMPRSPASAAYAAKMEAAEAHGALHGPRRTAARMRVVVLDDRTSKAGVEGGWPHTHGELICMPASYLDGADLAQLARTLAHERMHVCQRMEPGRCTTPRPAGRVSVADFDARFPDLAARRRSNPDLDGYLYGEDGWVVVSLFDSETAATAGGMGAAKVTRVDLSTGQTVVAPRGTYEHPNEAQAYASEDKYKN